ncbi:MAG TPA: homoserine kinase [Thermoanaerobaculia bacterium]|nr:homoserine kinase [Thermoanaerobaculia bacterium]
MRNVRSAARVYAPGSIGNLGPGFDALGLAVAGAGDTVLARRAGRSGVTILAAGHPAIPTEAARNSAGIAALDVLRRTGAEDVGVELEITKGLALAAGLGGSAASAVAAAVAVDLLLGRPLGTDDLLAASLAGEAGVAGRHLDNVAPSLLGGAVLVRSLDPIDAIRLPVPEALRVVLAHPQQELRTAEARAVLPQMVSREIAVHQLAHTAALVAGLCLGDLALIGRALDDRLAEPARSPLLPGFAAAKAAALAAGALGASISGSGPTLFALAASDEIAANVAAALAVSYIESGLDCDVRVAEVDLDGARELPDNP